MLEPWLREQLFEVVPSAIAVIDPDFRVVRANRAFEERFGEWQGRRCYEVYKGQKRRCPRCQATRCFADGVIRSRQEVGVDRKGQPLHYLVYMVPVNQADGTRPYLVEMSTDITRENQLEGTLARVNALNRTLVEASGHAIVARGPRGRIRIFNPGAAALFGWEAGEVVGRQPPAGMLPESFEAALRRGDEDLELDEVSVLARNGQAVPVRFHGVKLTSEGKLVGSAAFLEDLREVKQLEREKLDAERLATVGQTVAGLAHGVKNILTGLEGGLYLMRTGIDKGAEGRVRQGFEMLSRNIGRVTSFVRTLLDFSRGRAPIASVVNPVSVAEEVVYLYREAASREGIDLVVEPAGEVGLAAFDPDGIHTCLANLVTNALDACRMSEREDRQVRVRVSELPDPNPRRRPSPVPQTALVFEVADNGVGLDYEVKQKVFTNFFTTKGEGGTGLGLLVTRKIVSEHGGTIEVESEPGQGTTFRMTFPRRRLPLPVAGPEERGGSHAPGE